MATEVSAKLGLVITAQDEASQIFKDFAAKIMESMQSATDSVKPLAEAMQGMAEAVVGASDTTTGAQQRERDEIALTRQQLLEWARDNEESFKAVGVATNDFADVSTSDLKRVYQSVEDMRVTVVKDLTAIADTTDGPVVTSINKWRETVVMSADEIKAALQGIIDKDNTLSDLGRLLTDENSSMWKGMYQDLTGINVALQRVATEEDGVASSTRQLAESFGSMSKASSLQMVGSTVEGIGTKVSGLIVKSAEMGASFEQSVTNATAALNTRLSPAQQLTSDQIDAMANKALKLGQAGFFSANELADAMAVMSKNGMDYGNVMGGAISAVQNLAGATSSSLTDTAKTMTDIYNEYGPEVKKFGDTTEEQFNKVADLVTGAMSNSSISMNDFLTSMKYVGPVAGGLGMSLTDVATGISLVGKAGVTGSSAGTYFRSMLADLVPTTKTASAEMEKLGLITKDGANQFMNADGTVKSLAEQHDVLTAALEKLSPAEQDAAMKIMFGKRSLNGMEALIHTSSSALNDLSVVVDKNGTAQEVASAKMDTTAGRLKILESNFETLEKTIGIALLPVVESLIPIGQKMIDMFDGLSTPMKDVVVGLTAFAGVTLLISGKIMNTISMFQFFKIAMSDLIAPAGGAATGIEGVGVAADTAGAGVGFLDGALAILTSPITLVIAGIAALALAFYEAYQNCQVFRDGVNTVVTLVKEFLIQAWKDISTGITVAWKAISDFLVATWNNIKATVTDAWNYISPTIMNALKSISAFWSSTWPQIQQVFTGVWDVMVSFLSPILAELYVAISGALGLIQGLWSNSWGVVSSSFKLVWDGIVDALRTGWDLISGIFKVALDLLTGNWSKAWGDAKTTVVNVWNDIGAFLSNIAGNAVAWGANVIRAFIGGIDSMIGQVAQAASNVVNTVKNFMGFHSPAKMGPGAEADVWAPNLVGMFVDGLNAGVSKVADASLNLATPISDAFTSQVQSASALWNSTQFQSKSAQLNLNVATNSTSGASSSTNSALGSALSSINLSGVGTGSDVSLGSSPTQNNTGHTYNIVVNVNGTGKNGTQLGQDIAKQLRLQMPVVT